MQSGSDVRVAPESLFNLDAGITSAYIIDAPVLPLKTSGRHYDDYDDWE